MPRLSERPVFSGGTPARRARFGKRLRCRVSPIRRRAGIRNRVLAPAVRRANELRARRGLPPIDAHVTPHTLRRTYISIMLSAGAEIPYVQAQVGHRDPTLTLKIYALVLKRRNRRQFSDAFDQLMRDAIPSMQHAKMHIVRPLAEAVQGPPIAAETS